MDQKIETSWLRAFDLAQFLGTVEIGATQSITGTIKFLNSSNQKITSFQASAATADATYVLPTAAPASSGAVLSSTTAGVLSWLNAVTFTNLTVTGKFDTYDNTPTQISADQNNYAPGNFTILRLSTDATRTITGISGGEQGRHLWLINVGSNDLVLSNQSASSTSTNRIITTSAASFTMNADDSCHLWYDSTTARWRILQTSDALWG